MRFLPIEGTGLILIEPELHQDERGCFAEVLRQDQLAEHGIPTDLVQENFSRSTRGVLRGLHYQHPHAQGKLVRCISGAIYDVAVDLRRGSPDFGAWTAVEMHAGGHHTLWIPPGFAHGFYAMSELVEVTYHCTTYYRPEQSRTIAWDDPDLAIEWPIERVRDGDPILSEGDRAGSAFADAVPYEAN